MSKDDSITQAFVRERYDYHPDGYLVLKRYRKPRKPLAEKRYRSVKIGNKTYLEHKIIFLWHHGYMPTTIDHQKGKEQGNGVDNLRPATLSQNQGNRKINSNNASGFKGVSWHKAANKWVAQIQVENKKKHLGVFETKEEAAQAYRDAAIKYFGEFAKFD